MPALAFICTRPDAWDPFCRPEQLLSLFMLGAISGAVLTRFALRRTGRRHRALSVLFYALGCLTGALVVVSVGFQFSS